MKFSFEAENYRKNLAEDLKEKRSESREEAREMLEQERATLKYQIAKDIKKVLKKLEDGEEEQNEEHATNQESATEHEYDKEIWTETLETEGSDGEKHALEVTALDVSEEIPEEVKLMYDLYRLAMLDTELKDAGIGAGGAFSDEDIQRMAEYWEVTESRKPVDLLNLYYLSFVAQDKRDKQGNRLMEERHKAYEEFIKPAREKRKNFINIVTEGAYTSGDSLVHAVGGGWCEKGYCINMEKSHPEAYTKLMERFPHVRDGEVEEKPFDVQSAESEHLWFAPSNAVHRGAGWGKPDQILILCNAKNKRFQNEVENIHFAYGSVSADSYHEVLKNIQPNVEKRTMGDMMSAVLQLNEARLDFKRKEPWFYIADWVVDLYHGRVYKISEVDSKDGNNEDE